MNALLTLVFSLNLISYSASAQTPEQAQLIPICNFALKKQTHKSFDFDRGPYHETRYVPKGAQNPGNCDALTERVSAVDCRNLALSKAYACFQLVENKFWGFDFDSGRRSGRWNTCWACIAR